MSLSQLSAVLTSQGEYDVPCPERPQFAYHESILQNDCESILTKCYESILGMVIRHALQAAGNEDLLCRQPDTYVHHGELRFGTMGLVECREGDYSKCRNIRSIRLWSKYTNKLWTFLVW